MMIDGGLDKRKNPGDIWCATKLDKYLQAFYRRVANLFRRVDFSQQELILQIHISST